MNKPKHAGLASTARTSAVRVPKNSRSRQDQIDERVIAEAHDQSAWEAPVEVKRRGPAALQASLARRAAFRARLRYWEGKNPPFDRLEAEDETECEAGLMTRAELVEEVARVVELTKKQAETVVGIVFDSIVDSLRSGQKVEFRSFHLRSRKKVAEKLEGPLKKIPHSKPGKAKRGRTTRVNPAVKREA